MKNLLFSLTMLSAAVGTSLAQDTKLHVNPRWDECSFQLDESLTQSAWRQFTREAALVSYFRPLTDAKPMGVLNVEFSLLQWSTAIDDSDPAWNNTFVHPDSTHWLTEGSSLAFPGLMARVGVTDRLDVGAYWTKNPHANYGFFSGQLQYNLIDNPEKKWAASARLNFSSLYGPEDLTLRVYGMDVLASKEFTLYKNWMTLSPYVGVSAYVSSSHEMTAVVELEDEILGGGQAMVGALLKLGMGRLGVEYNFAEVNTFSLKVGVGF